MGVGCSKPSAAMACSPASRTPIAWNAAGSVGSAASVSPGPRPPLRGAARREPLPEPFSWMAGVVASLRSLRSERCRCRRPPRERRRRRAGRDDSCASSRGARAGDSVAVATLLRLSLEACSAGAAVVSGVVLLLVVSFAFSESSDRSRRKSRSGKRGKRPLVLAGLAAQVGASYRAPGGEPAARSTSSALRPWSFYHNTTPPNAPTRSRPERALEWRLRRSKAPRRFTPRRFTHGL